MASAERPQSPIYVSYATQDKEWAEIVTTYLRQARLEPTWQQFVRFSEESESWAREARSHARVFILLVSNAYLRSDEIHKDELPQIREMARSGKARIIYLIVENCPWRSALASPAEPTRVVPKEDRVLEKGSNSQRRLDLEDLVQEVRQAMERTEREPAIKSAEAREGVSGQSTEFTQEGNIAPVQTQSKPTGSPPQVPQQSKQGLTPNAPADPAAGITAAEAGRAKISAPGAEGQGKPLAGAPLAQRLALRFTIGNYQAMGTLISPTVLLTPAHVIEQSQILAQDAQAATILFLGLTAEPRSATVLDVDEGRDFAVLQLDRPVGIDPPVNLLRAIDFVDSITWESFWTTATGEFSVSGKVVGLQTSGDKTYLKLETSSPVLNAEGISGAPVLAGESLLGIIAAGENTGRVWYAVPLTEMLNSSETDALSGLLPADPRRPRTASSPWITEEDFARFSKEAIEVLSDARQIGRSLKSVIVHIRHLLLALFWSPGGLLSQLLLERDVDLEEVLKLQPGVGLPRGDFPVITKLPPITVNVRRALSLAIEKAGPEGPVDDRHILFGVLSATRNEDVRALNQAGITPALVRMKGDSARREAVLAGYQSDDASGADLLDITPEVEALASVLAAKDVEPPLSLGLFGDWGTGKSFFMGKLEAEIRRLGEDAKVAREQGMESAYCSNVVQIPFNAWNYIDTDLWASLTAEIFEGLAAAIAERRGHDSQEERALILAAASSSQTIFNEAEKKKNDAEAEFKRSEERLVELQKSDAEIEASLQPRELLLHAVQFAIQEKPVKEPLSEAAKALHIPEAEAAASHLQSQILELNDIWSTLGFTLKNDRKLWIWLAMFPLMMAIAWGICWVAFQTKASALVASLVATLTGASAILMPFLKTARKAFAFVQRAKESKEQLIEQHKKAQSEKLNEQRKENQKKLDAASQEFNDASAKLEVANKQLEDMRADRRLADYIKQRNQSTDYTQKLGIISRVRADLRQLSTLLRDVRKEGDDEFEKAMKERQEKARRDLFPRIDRIILYIDDLDRCPEKNVVEVLQAVHLLLAFPLFVVVVGVDPRWLLYSLQQSSSAFRANGTEKNEGEEKEGWQEDRHWQSTPLNYLEKIFQIPYSLRPIDQRGFGKLVDQFASGGVLGPPVVGQGQGASVPPRMGEEQKAGGAEVALPAPQPAGSSSPERGPMRPEALSPAAAPASPAQVPGAPAAIPGASGDLAGATRSGPAAPAATKSRPAVNRSPEHLNINDTERVFMKRLNQFIPTPRSGKRFINIYRLLRASVTESERVGFLGDQQGGEYQAAMLLLAILMGYPDQATEILRRLIEEQPEGTWWRFVDALGDKPSEEEETAKKSGRRKKPKQASEPSESGANVEKTEWGELLDRLGKLKKNFADRPILSFQTWAPRVARYSFQSGRVLYYKQN